MMPVMSARLVTIDTFRTASGDRVECIRAIGRVMATVVGLAAAPAAALLADALAFDERLVGHLAHFERNAKREVFVAHVAKDRRHEHREQLTDERGQTQDLHGAVQDQRRQPLGRQVDEVGPQYLLADMPARRETRSTSS